MRWQQRIAQALTRVTAGDQVSLRHRQTVSNTKQHALQEAADQHGREAAGTHQVASGAHSNAGSSAGCSTMHPASHFVAAQGVACSA